MLQIYVYGKEEGWLEVDANSILNIEGFSDLFDEEFNNAKFSLPYELQLTDNNRRKLGFAERLNNTTIVENYWKVDVYEDGWPILIGTKMSMLQRQTNWNYTKGKISVTITGVKGLFGSIVANKKLTDLVLGGPIKWGVQESRDWATDHLHGLYPQYDYFLFAPIAIENYFDTSAKDYDNEFLVRDTVNDSILTYTGGTYKVVFGRENPSVPYTVIPSGTSMHEDYRTIPFFKLKYVLKKCFEEFGFTITGDFIDDADFDKICLFNNYALEKYQMSTLTDYNNIIIPSNHVPDIKIVDFLSAIFMALNIYPVFDGSSNVKLTFRVTKLQTINAIDITDKIIDDLEVTPQSSSDNSNNGFTIGYNWENDDYYSDRVKEKTIVDGITYIGEKELIGTVTRLNDLSTFSYIRTLTTNDCVFVHDQNMYYSVADATVTPILWDCYAENIGNFKYGEGSKTIDIGLSTLCQYVLLNTTTGLYYNSGKIGCRMKGNYNTNKGTRVKNNYGLKLFFAEYYNDVSVGKTVVAYNHNTLDTGGVSSLNMGKWSLAINTDTSLIKKNHLDWQLIKEKKLVVKTTILADQKVLHDFNTYSQFIINNIVFLLYKTEQTSPLKGNMVIYLVPM